MAVFDPVHTEEDLQALEALGVEPLEEEKGARYGIAEPTLFFMPHCPRQLYNNVLWANFLPQVWDKDWGYCRGSGSVRDQVQGPGFTVMATGRERVGGGAVGRVGRAKGVGYRVYPPPTTRGSGRSGAILSLT